MSGHHRQVGAASIDLFDALVTSGLSLKVAHAIDKLPQRSINIDSRRPFREPGSGGDEVYFVRSGILSKYWSGYGGRRQILDLRFPGESVWPDDFPDYGLQAIVKSEVIVLQKSVLETLLDEFPELAIFCMTAAQRFEAINHQWLVNCGSKGGTARVAHLLCETAFRSGNAYPTSRFSNPFTQQQIADITGQTNVNVNRVFRELEREGLIQRQGKDILVDDWTELKRVANFRADYLD